MARHELILPELGIDGPATVSLWLVEPGSPVRQGQPVVEITAGSAAVDLSATADGFLVETFVGEDEPVAVGQVLAVIGSDDAFSPDA